MKRWYPPGYSFGVRARQAWITGVTLPEMLVLMAIMAVLAGVLWGGYKTATGAALGTKNLQHHRVINRALLDYAAEHHGRLPWGNDLDPPFGGGASSYPNSTAPYPKTLAFSGYVSDATVFYSPRFLPRWGQNGNRDGMMAVLGNPGRFPGSTIPWAYPSYAVNRYGAMPTSSDAGRPAHLGHVGQEGNLSKLMLVRDVYSPANDTPSRRLGGGNYWFFDENTVPSYEDCYNGLVHASFADGHVEGIAHAEMIRMMRSGNAAPLFRNVYTQ